MRIITIAFFCLLFSVVSGQNDTLTLSGRWGKLKFDTTTVTDGQLITGKSKDVPMENHYLESSREYSKVVTFYEAYYWIDSLKTMYYYTSLDTNLGDQRTIRKMEFYGDCKVKLNGTWQIDKSSKTQIKKKYGEPKYINEDIAMQLKWHTYHLFVNGTLCAVDFYYDYSGVLRKVTIESLQILKRKQ